MDRPDTLLVDARGRERFDGTSEPIERTGGLIEHALDLRRRIFELPCRQHMPRRVELRVAADAIRRVTLARGTHSSRTREADYLSPAG